jgi:peptide methionine sulfoxide reductase MsrB
MKMKRITYKIKSNFGLDPKVVSGYAVDSDLGVRFCVRKKQRNYWSADHFDTGCSIPGFGTTAESCAKDAYAFLRVRIDDGSYAKAIARLEAESINAEAAA